MRRQKSSARKRDKRPIKQAGTARLDRAVRKKRTIKKAEKMVPIGIAEGMHGEAICLGDGGRYDRAHHEGRGRMRHKDRGRMGRNVPIGGDLNWDEPAEIDLAYENRCGVEWVSRSGPTSGDNE